MMKTKDKIKDHKGNKEKGFAAFILVTSISSLMLAFTFMNLIEYGHFFDQVQTKEYRLMSYYSAYSCIDQALLTLTRDYFFEINREIIIADLSCSVLSVKDENGLKMISVYGNYKNIKVYRRATARLHDDHLEIISIE
jgi:hypothetical protein